ncbi:hypothetical protein [Aliivibrio fischeri]|uniref:hypothetical protein n=1 Tax=Aliivibrio fischeri TaxID=668 RepID=UPI0037355054
MILDFNHSQSKSVLNDIEEEINRQLNTVGIMFRMFARAKTLDSLNKKIENDDGYGKSKKIQDLLGIRIVLYFSDDIEIVRDLLKTVYNELESDNSIDKHNETTFAVTKYNLVYRLSEEETTKLDISNVEDIIDNTFELQIRTIFSEGWHEVEHDLRYKCKSDWEDQKEPSRLLHGVYASLENSEWTMLKVLDDLSYHHYKNKNWESMLRQKFRLKIAQNELHSSIIDFFDSNIDIAKSIFRVSRSEVILKRQEVHYPYPDNLTNLVYFISFYVIKNQQLNSLIPSMMLETLQENN